MSLLSSLLMYACGLKSCKSVAAPAVAPKPAPVAAPVAPTPAEKAEQEAYYARTVAALTESDADWAAMSFEHRSDMIYRVSVRDDLATNPITDEMGEFFRSDRLKAAALAAEMDAAYLACPAAKASGLSGWWYFGAAADRKKLILDSLWDNSKRMAWSAAYDIATGRDAAWYAARLECEYHYRFRTVATFKKAWAQMSYNERRSYIFRRYGAEQDARNYPPATGGTYDMSQVTGL